MVTSIQLNENVKRDLDRLRNGKETYESIILGLMKMVKSYKANQERLMKEGCLVMYDDMLELNKELEGADGDIDWEW